MSKLTEEEQLVRTCPTREIDHRIIDVSLVTFACICSITCVMYGIGMHIKAANLQSFIDNKIYNLNPENYVPSTCLTHEKFIKDMGGETSSVSSSSSSSLSGLDIDRYDFNSKASDFVTIIDNKET